VVFQDIFINETSAKSHTFDREIGNWDV